jgi:hypothetical protein
MPKMSTTIQWWRNQDNICGFLPNPASVDNPKIDGRAGDTGFKSRFQTKVVHSAQSLAA